MLGSRAEGVTEVSGFLEGEDALATLNAFRAMGVTIEGPDNGRVVINGVGLRGLQQPKGELYVGNSGTSMRLLAGILAGQNFTTTMTGDESLSKRPMERVAAPLRLMGVEVQTEEGGRPPLTICGNGQVSAIQYDLPMASAQVKSCVLLAGLYADGQTSTTEPAPTRDHTERMLNGFAYPVKVKGATATLQGGGSLQACTIDVPADISSAAFFMVAAAIAPGSDITLSHVGINPTRIGVINILRAMGTDISINDERVVGGEPVADIRVRYAPLTGIKIDEDQVPLAIDEFPALFIAASCATGTTILTGAEELRVKESDRIQVMVDGLQSLGVDAQGTEDGAIIKGSSSSAVFSGGRVNSHHDHRIAMAFAIASLRASDTIIIEDCDNVATSFPNFISLASRAGIDVQVNS
jgi:3-phosphoshikimate 1-carboxyvinyltransferase